MATSGTTPSYPGLRPSGPSQNKVEVYETPRTAGSATTRTGTTARKSSTAMWWILAALAIALILYFMLR